MLIVFACLLLAASVLVLGVSVRISRRTTAEAIRSVGSYGYGAEPVVPVRGRDVGNLTLENRFASIARRFTPADYESRLKLRLIQAGLYDARPARFLMLRVLAVDGAGHCRAAVRPGLRQAACCPWSSSWPPHCWAGCCPIPCSRRGSPAGSTRSSAMRRTSSTCSRSPCRPGLGLDQSMKIAAERLHGPLADEVRLMLNEIRVGQSRQEALRRLAERADTPTVRSFARTMAQGESMGVSIGQTLKALAIDARARKKALADELAQKAPVKMVFPLAICFFPAILIITAGPGIIAIMKTLGG